MKRLGVDLRPQIRKIRDDKSRQHLIEEGIYNLSLEEYAERKVCGKPFAELTEHEIREIGRMIFKQVGNYPYWHLEYNAPLEEHIKEIKEKIEDTIQLYKEMNGRYGKRGKLLWTRRNEQAKKLNLS